MNNIYYDMIFKRKSFHIFKNILPLESSDLQMIEAQICQLEPLYTHIKTSFRIVPTLQTTCKRGEYCILIYSEMKENYLQNIGYLGEQLDLWLASKNIGVCWYGVGNPNEPKYNGLDFIIMLAIGKTSEKNFRKDYTKSKRKPIEDIWSGNQYSAIAEVIRYAPSACNSQPWIIEYQENQILLYRIKGKRGIMPQDKVAFYNRIDIGIMIFFIDVCLTHQGLYFKRELFGDFTQEEVKVLNAKYLFSQKHNLSNEHIS